MIVAVLSGKGGVGKTTIIASLGHVLASKSKRTLLVDMDFFTRGLTHFVTRGHTRFETSVYSILSSRDWRHNSPHLDAMLYEIEPNLSLLPPTESARSVTPDSEVEDLMKNSMADFSDWLRLAERDFEFILIDARSGADYLSLVPALVAGTYWLVVEEDRTSQRTSRVLLDALDSLTDKTQSNADFDGFILNMVTTPRLRSLVLFYEETVFSDAPCLAVIPLSATVRKLFVRDEIVAKSRPGLRFSTELEALADNLTGPAKTYPRDRSEARWLLYAARRSVLPILTLYMGIAVIVFVVAFEDPSAGTVAALAAIVGTAFLAFITQALLGPE